MTATYDCIATTTLTSATTTVSFSSISSNYTDLVCVIQASSNHTNDGSRGYMRFNGDSNQNYSNVFIRASGATAGNAESNRDNSATFIAYGVVGNNTTSFPLQIIHIMNYANSTTFKTTLSSSNNPRLSDNGKLRLTVGTWRSTAAINSIALTADDPYLSGSTFALYGIKAE